MISTAVTVAFTAVYLAVTLWMCRGVKLGAKALCLGSLACALTLVLSMIYIALPTGSSIACLSVLPLMVLSLVYDPKLAMICGWICGALATFLIPGWQPVHWGQIFVEHMVCFSCLGYAGIFGNQKRWHVLAGTALASALKIAGHILSGVIFFSQNAWDGWGAWGYSIAYNLSSTLPECAIGIALLLILPLGVLEKSAKGGAMR